MSTFTRRAKRAHAVTLSPDVYAGRILAAKLEVIEDIAKALGVEPNEDELGTLREGYIARAREQALAAIAPVITPRLTRLNKLTLLRAAKKEREAEAALAKTEALLAEAKTTVSA